MSEWRDGDVIICNDPYAGCTHTPDLVLFSPVFFEDTLIAVASTVAHHIDVGGRVPGSESATAREIFEEGLRIPPLKLFDAGRPNDTFFRIFARNVRDPKASTGDINAQVAACRTAERRVKEIAAKYGREGFAAHVAAVFDYSEAFLRSALREVAAQRAFAEILIEDDASSSEPMRLAVTASVEDGGLVVDFAGTSPQRQNGLNNPFASTISMVHYAVKVVFTPGLPQNEGCNRPVTVRVPEGSILNPREPAAVSVRHLTQQAVADVVLKALSAIAPGASIAGCQISFPTFAIGGFDERPAVVARTGMPPYFVVTDIIGGGMGASSQQGGVSGRRYAWRQLRHPLRRGARDDRTGARLVDTSGRGIGRRGSPSGRPRHRTRIRDAVVRPGCLRLYATDAPRDRAMGTCGRRRRGIGARGDRAAERTGGDADQQVRRRAARAG